jgi:CRP-like cAMP-binding protein
MSPVTLKFQRSEDFSEAELRRIEALLHNSRHVGARVELAKEGLVPSIVHVMLEGVASCCKLLDDGKRAIVGYLVPGDFCDLAGAVYGRQDYSVMTLTPCTIAEVPAAAIDELIRSNPKIARALWRATLAEAGISRAWLVCAGQRTSAQHLAHFICELVHRMKDTSSASEELCPFPMTQEELADTLGITSVHVSRTFQQLKEDGFIEVRGRAICILNYSELKRFARFDPAYLSVPQIAASEPMACTGDEA